MHMLITMSNMKSQLLAQSLIISVCVLLDTLTIISIHYQHEFVADFANQSTYRSYG